jgi:hypothetical protein
LCPFSDEFTTVIHISTFHGVSAGYQRPQGTGVDGVVTWLPILLAPHRKPWPSPH